ncbi:sensor histidine kinase [Thermosipho atlanticus]|uniref:histidine kinase n=1 Tax=Thermosipho atlanticus DSM 15807 TaxID=1123380 RepID=A0A1M5RS59_9BACT|nr:HAMP domain-containing sensor histidine kinase [Thermosipho atlanticus]SHH29105.1 Signal transduction histidine kinase [Thermosipho atlanticus DSM 15807]
MSLTSKITYLTTLIVAIVLSIVLITFYFSIRTVAINSIKNDLRESATFLNKHGFGTMERIMRGMFLQNSKRDFYLIYNGEVLSDPYNLGYLDIKMSGLQKIGDRTFYFLKINEKMIVAKDITPIMRFLNDIRMRFFLIYILAVSLTSFLTYIVSKNSMKHLKNFVTELANIKGNDLGFRFIKPNTNDEIDELVEKFNELMDRVEKNYKLQEEFVSNVSHELKTPIANLIGYSEMLRRWGYKDKTILEESVESIRETAYKMKELIENMLLLSKNYQLTTEKIDMRPLTEKIVKLKEKQYNVKISLSGNGTIIANKEALERIISNLLENAILHGKPPYEIKLSENKIEIIDHGPGISKEEQEKIFERFYKSRSSKGHGLGLFLVKQLCNQMNLKISIESKNGYTKFEIREDSHEK